MLPKMLLYWGGVVNATFYLTSSHYSVKGRTPSYSDPRGRLALIFHLQFICVQALLLKDHTFVRKWAIHLNLKERSCYNYFLYRVFDPQPKWNLVHFLYRLHQVVFEGNGKTPQLR